MKTWNFNDSNRCKFQLEALKSRAIRYLEAIEEAIKGDLFVPEEFEALVVAAAQENKSVGKLLDELREPRQTKKTVSRG